MTSLQSNAILAGAAPLAAAKPIAPAANNGSDTSFAALLTNITANPAVAASIKTPAANTNVVMDSGIDSKPADPPTNNQVVAHAADPAALLNSLTAAPASPQIATLARNDDNTGDTSSKDNKPSLDKRGADKTAPDKIDAGKADANATAVTTAQVAAMQAPLPPTAAQATPAETAPSDSNVAATGGSNKSNRTPTPRAPASATPAPAGPASGDADEPAAANSPVAAAQENIKAPGHAGGKGQSSENQNQADQTAAAGKMQAQPDPALAPAASPAPQPANANLSGVTAPVTNGISATNPPAHAAVTTSLHAAPQGAAPNVNGLAVEIAVRSQSGAKEFQIRLDPPELGHVEVRLSIDANGKTEAHMTADQPQTLHLLQQDSQTLTRALREAGLDVSQDSLNFSLKGQERQGGDNGGARARGPSLSLTATKTIDAAQSANAYRSSDARLDIHV